MKTRVLILGSLLSFAATLGAQGTDSTIYVKQFPGANVGAKVTAAMGSCPAMPVGCILVIDPSLGSFANGTFPVLPANAVLKDYRFGQPGFLSGTNGPSTTNGVIHPEVCASAGAPSWCTGATADAWIRAACGQLPATGGVIDLVGFGATQQTLAASISGCMSNTKLVWFDVSPVTYWLITENDGGTVFPFFQYSGISGTGVGQCMNSGGFHLASTANVNAIFGNATSGHSMEAVTIKGVCAFGAAGATVAKGLIYLNGLATNTTIEGNNLFECNAACIRMDNVGGEASITGNWGNVSDGVTGITGSALVLSTSGSPGIEQGDIDIHGNTFEHAQGGASYPEVSIHGDGTSTWQSRIWYHENYSERDSVGTPDTIAIKVQDCFNCTIENDGGGGGTGGTTFVDVSNSAGNSWTQNVRVRSISSGGAWTNVLNDEVTPKVYPSVTYPIIGDVTVAPGFFDNSAFPANGVLVAAGTDVFGGAGTFSLGTAGPPNGVPAGWTINSVPSGWTAAYTLDATNPPPSSPCGAGQSYAEKFTVTTATGGGALYLSYATPLTLTVGERFTVTFCAQSSGGTFDTIGVRIGNSAGSANNCPVQNFLNVSSSWTEYTFVCNVTTASGGSFGNAYFQITGIALAAGQTGSIWVGAITDIPGASGVPGSVAVWTNQNTLSVGTGLPQSISGCRNTTLESTSATSATTIWSCLIPAGTVGTTSRVHVATSLQEGSSNSGTCTYSLRLAASTSPSAGTGMGGTTALAGHGAAELEGDVYMKSSLSVENVDTFYTYSVNVAGSGSSTANIASTSPMYVNLTAASSAGSPDTCNLFSADVTLYP
jgi:hypothetical protein